MPTAVNFLNRLPLLMGLLLLAACSSGSVTPPRAETPAPAPIAQPEQLAEEAPAPAAPPANPDRLLNQTPRDVIALMGEPGLVRWDGAVQIMLFENRDCVLEVVFREPDPNAYFSAQHIAARNRKGDEVDTQACLTQLLPNGHWPDQ